MTPPTHILAPLSLVGSSSRLNAVPPTAAVAASVATRGVGTHFLVRILFLRGLALVYGVAFLVALQQNKALIGDSGITPARRSLDNAEELARSKRERRRRWLEERKKYKTVKEAKTRVLGRAKETIINSKVYETVREIFWDRSDRMGRPLVTLLWLAKDRSRLNSWLDGIAAAGLAMATGIFLTGSANVPLLLGLWICQRSLMAVGGPWYGYGWEPQLAELGFHALFMVPLLSLNPIPASSPVPSVVVWAMRWFLFRIMLGAGLIKIKSGDRKWKDLTAMDHFYETQPVPNMFTRYFHWAPKWWHKFEVVANHFVELVAPWLMILPGLNRKWRITGGVIQIIFQSVLIVSGNLSFLNWLTMLPAVFCLDDAFLSRLFIPVHTTSASVAAYMHLAGATAGAGVPFGRQLANFLFGTLIGTLSIPVVQNLVAKRQLMNASFDPLRLVNTYGAFGVVNKDRVELIVESAEDINGPWKEYEFKVKPGNVMRRPRWISPYHYRLDWQMWIASSCGAVERSPWMYSFLLKLLQQDPEVLKLLACDPWANEAKEKAGTRKEGDTDSKQQKGYTDVVPKYIRVQKYKYAFNPKSDGIKAKPKPYWIRERVGAFFPRQGVATKSSLSQ